MVEEFEFSKPRALSLNARSLKNQALKMRMSQKVDDLYEQMVTLSAKDDDAPSITVSLIGDFSVGKTSLL
jgi:hypothetical protein